MDIKYGECHCGCGEKTKISKHTRNKRGYKKGEPSRYIHNHNLRGKVGGMLGKKHSEETKRKMSEIGLGLGRLEEKHPAWKGDEAGVGAKHSWVRSKRGTPSTCEHCGKTGLNGNEIDWANKDHKYRRDLADWMRLCRKCHKKYDREFN